MVTPPKPTATVFDPEILTCPEGTCSTYQQRTEVLQHNPSYWLAAHENSIFKVLQGQSTWVPAPLS